MKEITALQEQLTNILKSMDEHLQLFKNSKMTPPTKIQQTLVRQIVTAGFPFALHHQQLVGFIDQVAHLQREGTQKYYKIPSSGEKVYIHPTSFLFSSYPEWCVFREITQTTKFFMKGVTEIDPSWLALVGGPLCHFSKPLETPPPK